MGGVSSRMRNQMALSLMLASNAVLGLTVRCRVCRVDFCRVEGLSAESAEGTEELDSRDLVHPKGFRERERETKDYEPGTNPCQVRKGYSSWLYPFPSDTSAEADSAKLRGLGSENRTSERKAERKREIEPARQT